MFEFTFPSDTREVINSIRGAIGRDVSFLSKQTTACSGCSLDPSTNTSVNPFCPVCDGYGYIITYSGTTLSGHVLWGKSEETKWETGGVYPEGDCRVQIEHTNASVTVVDNASYVSIDDRRLRITKVILRGVPDINRILIDLMEEEEE